MTVTAKRLYLALGRLAMGASALSLVACANGTDGSLQGYCDGSQVAVDDLARAAEVSTDDAVVISAEQVVSQHDAACE